METKENAVEKEGTVLEEFEKKIKETISVVDDINDHYIEQTNVLRIFVETLGLKITIKSDKLDNPTFISNEKDSRLILLEGNLVFLDAKVKQLKEVLMIFNDVVNSFKQL